MAPNAWASVWRARRTSQPRYRGVCHAIGAGDVRQRLAVVAPLASCWRFRSRELHVVSVNEQLHTAKQNTNSNVSWHLTAEQRAKLATSLRLQEGEIYYIEINSATSCETCENYAQELREVMGDIPGLARWGFYSSEAKSTIRNQCKAHLWLILCRTFNYYPNDVFLGV
jgi:hypothetical protein